jgi:hypothetical protein
MNFLGATMGKCKYCGEPAGFLRKKHAECEDKFQQHQRVIQDGREKIVRKVSDSINGAEDFNDLERAITKIEKSFFVSTDDRQSLLIEGWEKAVEAFLDDDLLDASEESRLVTFKNYFDLSQSDLDENGFLTKVTKSAILRDVMDGKIPERCSIDGNLPINFQKGEYIVWAFPNSPYLEDKTRREFIGGSRGVSVRVMKGVYYRAGAFKGQAVEHTERVHVDQGWVVLTNKNLYFAGSRKSMRIPYVKIVSFEQYSNGIGIMRDAATAKPQIFVTNDGWFTYNLIANLSQI